MAKKIEKNESIEMNEKVKIYVVLVAVLAIVGIVIGYNIYTVKQSEKNYTEFENNFNSSEQKMILIGRDDCPYCQYYQPYMDYYQQKYEFSYQYINTNKLTSDDLSKILETVGINEDDFGTPLTLFVENGEVLNQIDGYVDEKELLTILQKQEFVGEEEQITLSYLDLDSLKKTVDSNEKSVIVFGQTTCGHCINFKPVLMNIVDDKDINIYYINCNTVEDTDALYEYLENFEPFQGKWGTPLTIIFEDGEIVDTFSGETDYKTFVQFLTENEIIK